MIDKLSITLDVPIQRRTEVLARLGGMVLNHEISNEQNRYSELLKGYRCAYHLHFDASNTCTIQASPFRTFQRFLRFEWNPNKATKVCESPTIRIIEILHQAIPNFDVESIMLSNLTRIDISFDLYRIPIESFFITYSIVRKPVSGRYVQIAEKFGANGHLNSVYIGKADADQYLLIYDKNLEQEQRNLGGSRQLQGSSPYPARPTTRTRFELRLRDVGSPQNFLDRENPFAAYHVQRATSVQSWSRQHEWQFFVDSCRRRGPQAALSLIENPRTRARFRDNLRQIESPAWWSPAEIWDAAKQAFLRSLAQ